MNRNVVAVNAAKMNTARETSAHLHRLSLLNFDMSDKSDARQFSFSGKYSQTWHKSPFRREFDHDSPIEIQRPKLQWILINLDLQIDRMLQDALLTYPETRISR